MINKFIKKDGKNVMLTDLTGKSLLLNPYYNKGTAFTERERLALGLKGKLPSAVENMDVQLERVYQQFLACKDDFRKNI